MILATALALPFPFEREYMQLALLGAVVVGATAPLIGTFLVQKQLSLLGDGIGHVAFAGVAAGLLLDVWPVWTALIAAVTGAVALEWLRSRGHTSGDLALSLFFYTGIAAGVVLTGLAGALDSGLLTYLFGSILTMSPGDAATIVVLGVLIASSVAVTWRALFSVVLDEESARVAGLPVMGLNFALSALTAVTVVAAMRVVGLLLVAALMVLPVASAQRICRSFRATLLASSAFGAAAGAAGLIVARLADLPPGATIVLAAAALFAGAAVWDKIR